HPRTAREPRLVGRVRQRLPRAGRSTDRSNDGRHGCDGCDGRDSRNGRDGCDGRDGRNVRNGRNADRAGTPEQRPPAVEPTNPDPGGCRRWGARGVRPSAVLVPRAPPPGPGVLSDIRERGAAVWRIATAETRLGLIPIVSLVGALGLVIVALADTLSRLVI